MILFVNGCARTNSRTLDLAKTVLDCEKDTVLEVSLFKDGPEPLNEERLLLRDGLLRQRAYDHPLLQWAVQFAQADAIVIAAPYWDLMFPAVVRAYLEAVTVSGITFFYNEHGLPEGLCKAKKLIYVTTSGGPITDNLGFEYVEKLAKTFYGISDVRFASAEGLDIWGNDPSAILQKAKEDYCSR